MSRHSIDLVSTPYVALLADVFRTLGDPGVASVYLFGSQATGRTHRESDVDVGVLLCREVYASAPARFEARLRLTSAIIAGLAQNTVDVVILNDAPPGLGRAIVTAGRQVFCADEEAAHAFLRDVQLRAADLEPFLRRTRRVKLAAITAP